MKIIPLVLEMLLMIYLLVYLLLINTYGFILIGIDKRKAIRNHYRISHKKILVLSLVG